MTLSDHNTNNILLVTILRNYYFLDYTFTIN